MESFLQELIKPFILFGIGFLIGLAKAHLRKSPLSKKEELIRYHNYLKKPVFWSFVAMFTIFLVLGIAASGNPLEVFKKSLLAGLYTSAAIYVFMIWGANLIRGG